VKRAAIVIDASPIIFLGKLDRLGLFDALELGSRLVPDAVQAELLGPSAPPVLRPSLERFIATCEVVAVAGPPIAGPALSFADRCVLALAIERKARLLVADDLPLRKLAEVYGVTPLGTLGVLLLAIKRGILSPDEVLDDAHSLVSRHGFRVGIETYAEFQRRMQKTG